MSPPFQPSPDPAALAAEARRRRRIGLLGGGIVAVAVAAAVGLLIPRGDRAADVDTRITFCARMDARMSLVEARVEAVNSSRSERRVTALVEIWHPDGRLLGREEVDLGEVPGRSARDKMATVRVPDPPAAPECRVTELSVV